MAKIDIYLKREIGNYYKGWEDAFIRHEESFDYSTKEGRGFNTSHIRDFAVRTMSSHFSLKNKICEKISGIRFRLDHPKYFTYEK